MKRKIVDPIDEFAEHVSGAVRAFFVLIKDWRSATGTPTHPGKEKSPRTPKPSAFDWTRLVKIASTLLSKEPTRRWEQKDFVQAVKAAGGLESAKGLHLGLFGRLKTEQLITRTGKTSFISKLASTSKAMQGTARKTSKVAPKSIEKKAITPIWKSTPKAKSTKPARRTPVQTKRAVEKTDSPEETEAKDADEPGEEKIESSGPLMAVTAEDQAPAPVGEEPPASPEAMIE